MDYSRSLEELENEVWNSTDFPTSLVQKCHEFRKIPLQELKPDQLRLLISQNIGLVYLIPLVLKILKKNILTDAEFYEGDLLFAVLTIETSFLKANHSLSLELLNLVTENRSLLFANKKLNREVEIFLEKLNSTNK